MDVGPIQTVEGDRIKREVKSFIGKTVTFKTRIRKQNFFAYECGPKKAYSELDKVGHLLRS